MAPTAKVGVMVRLPQDLYDWLKAEARRRDTTMTEVVNEALRVLQVASK
jgi:hypothetical protein